MRRLPTLILTIALCGLFSCTGQQDSSDNDHKTYEIGNIPDIKSFMTLHREEINMDERYPINDTLRHKGAFRNNRSRIFLDRYRNGKIQKKDSIYYNGLPTHCYCNATTDTTFIRIGIGFFGGFGFTIKIYQDKFESNFFEYADDVKPYKTDLNDTTFFEQIIVDNKFRTLILDSELTHEKGEQLTGLLTYTTNDYYEKNYSDSLDIIYLTGKIYFTCKIKEMQNETPE